MEDNGLEYTSKTRGKTHILDSAARNAARLAPEALELIGIINAFLDEGNTERLADLLQYARSIAERPKAKFDAIEVDDDNGDGPSNEKS